MGTEEKKIVEAKFKKNTIANVLLILGLVLIVTGLGVTASSMKYFRLKYFLSPEFKGTFLTYAGILLLIVQLVFRLLMSKCALYITNQRVKGKTSFGKQVDLPINQISAIGLSWASSLVVSTSSGKVSFWLLANRDEVYNELSKLVGNTPKAETSITNTTIQEASNADELKKFKDLLDSGIISQEEFDAKKKQLLGL